MEPLHISQLGIYNPGRLTDEQIERLFTARIGLLDHLIKVSTNQKVTSTPQHQLVVGPRGMGKSTLLHRIAAELRKEPYKQSFIPLTFPEEQYNVDRIEKLWLNCLDALADALEREGNTELLDQLDDEVEQHRELGENGVDLAEVFRVWTKKVGRRPVLLIDNMSLIFSGLDKQGQHALREALMRRGAPILVAASVIRMSETEAYEAPFYDAFQVHTLPKLSFSEAQKIIKNLAQQSDNNEVLSHLKQRPARLRALYDLTGGTPRTLMLLYPMIQAGFSADIRTDLDGLLDIITPLYKARLDELPVQVQVILDAVALHWSPIDLDGLRNTTQLKNQQLSPQLKRLIESGWLRKLDNVKPGGKGKAYEMNERFFNIWYLMRRSSRRQKRELLSFSKFLETFYGEDLNTVAQNDLAKGVNDRKDAFRHLALSQALQNQNPALSTAIRAGVLKHNSARDWLGDLVDQVEYKPAFTKDMKSFISSIYSLEGDDLREYTENLIRKDPKNINRISETIINHAIIDIEKTEIVLKEVLKNDQSLTRSWAALGYLYHKHFNRHEEAETAYRKALEIESKNAEVWLLLGNLLAYKLGRKDEAEVAYHSTLEINPEHSHAWYMLGNLFINLTRYEEAESAYRKALIFNPEDSSTWASLGYLYHEHFNRYEEAESAYRKALIIDPESSFSWFALGHILKDHKNRYEEAESAYLSVINIDPKNKYAWCDLGNLLRIHLNRYQEAEEAFNKALDIDPEYASAWNSLGNLLIMRPRNTTKAKEALKKALKLKPSPWISFNLIYLLRDLQGKYEEAQELYFQYKESDPKLQSVSDLNRSLFKFYNQDVISSLTGFSDAITHLGNKGIYSDTIEDWQRYAAVFIYYGHTDHLLNQLESSGANTTIRPYAEAIRAASSDIERHLLSIPAEMREPTRQIAKGIVEFVKLLENTEHLRDPSEKARLMKE